MHCRVDSKLHRSDWLELFGMARAKEVSQRYYILFSVAILLVELVGWEGN